MITDEQIKAIHRNIIAGTTVQNATKELGISRAFYYQKIKELGLSTKREIHKKNRPKNVKIISDMHDLALLLNTDFNTVHKYVNTKKSVNANIKRMSYLKINSPLKFQEAVIITILNYYKINSITLIKLLQNL